MVGSEGIMLVYSVTDKHSFMALEGWLVEVRKYANPDVNIFVVGNKSDLETERQVSYDEGQVHRVARLGLCQEAEGELLGNLRQNRRQRVHGL